MINKHAGKFVSSLLRPSSRKTSSPTVLPHRQFVESQLAGQRFLEAVDSIRVLRSLLELLKLEYGQATALPTF
jgi:hypothetical protein